MDFTFLLLARHDGRPLLPVAEVARDYFELTPERFLRKLKDGSIELPLVTMEADSQKAAKGIMVTDLAAYMKARSLKARQDLDKMRI